MKRSLRSWLWRVDITQEVDEELAFHIEMRTRELVDRGLDPRIAREMVIARLGDVNRLRRTCVDLGRKRERQMRLRQTFEELRDDVRFALRQMRASSAFTAVAAITLALGIGANGAIFSLVDATLLRPLPLPGADRLVVAWEGSEAAPRGGVAPADFLDWNARSRTFEKFAGFIPGVGAMVMAGSDGAAETVPRQWVTRDVFDVLGVRPVAGRTFLESDETATSGSVVVSEGFWRARFASDPSLVGREIRLDGMPFTVVGVVPREAQLIGSTSIWALIPLGRIPNRGPRVFRVVGRMKPEATLDGARGDMAAVAGTLASDFPATNRELTVTLEPLHDVLVGSDLRVTSMLFLGVVGVVLLICCANVANLLLARATARERELTIRSALGAGRRRIVRQLLTESLVLAALGGVLGIAIGGAILDVAPSVVPEGLLPPAVVLTFDARVVGFCTVTALLVGVLFGLAPAWHIPEFSLAHANAAGSRTTTGRGGGLRQLLVVSEVAAAVLLLFGAGLLLRTLVSLASVDRGYRTETALTMLVDPLGGRYPTKESLLQFFGAAEREVMSAPGVRSIAWASTLPLGESTFGPASFKIIGDPPVDENRRPMGDYQIVSPGYFSTVDLPVISGRPFNDSDSGTSVMVCMVNEAFVRRHLQGRSPIGVRVAVRSPTSGQETVREIVGVAHQVKRRPDEGEDFVQIYVPLAQDPFDDIFLVVRPQSGQAEALAPSVRAAIARVDKEQLVGVRSVMTLDEIASEATSRHRFRAVLVTTFAGLSLMLAMIGVFGVLAYSVQQRVREFGVRIALGATTSQVLGLVLGSAARMIGIGMAIGLVAATLLARSVAAFLFGVQPLDPVTFATVAVVLAVTAIAAAVVPARRAARVDPVEAFRSE